MAGIGSGEYPAIDIAGLAIDIIVLVLTGIKNEGTNLGQLIAIAIVMAVLATVLATVGVVFGVFIMAIMKMTKIKASR